MLIPQIKRSPRGYLLYQWIDSKTGFKYGSNSFKRFLKYYFVR